LSQGLSYLNGKSACVVNVLTAAEGDKGPSTPFQLSGIGISHDDAAVFVLLCQ
jgi:hypothetical protein